MTSSATAPRLRLALMGAGLIALLLTSGCSQAPPPSITLADANARAVTTIREVASVIGGDPERLVDRGASEQSCQSDSGTELTGQSRVTQEFVQYDLTVPDVRATSDAVSRRVGTRGFRRLDRRESDRGVSTRFRNDDDRFTMSVDIAPELASISVTSPCVWPDGTPP